MVLYDVIISPKALSQLNDYIDYIQYTLLNEQAASSMWDDALETRDHLTYVAESLRFCEKSSLRKLGYRIISFQRHQYIMLYRVTGRYVYVDGIYHQLQDYENIFAREIRQGWKGGRL